MHMDHSNFPLWLIPIFPFLGAVWNGVLGKRFSHRAVAVVAVGATAVSFLLSLQASLGLHGTPRLETLFPWIAAASFQVDFNFLLDPLSAVMCLVVTGVGLLIHIYAVGYMSEEDGFYRFFSYMNLFLFFMLTLVLAGNYLLMFVGWEGVGLCSFLLIGYYFRQNAAADAAKKAFIVTRLGDCGFLIALVLIYWTFDSLDFGAVFTAASGYPMESGGAGPLTLICLLLLMGATGKSAQVPLYVWLPDAMLGPTPVSALIHAATMVTAGVYMIARSSVLYVHAPTALLVVAIIGAVTAFYAATIGLVQTDIKRILAYSTISQIGYMVMACGVAAFSAAVFHLMTHAFFKALLFLGAGSVIHSIGGEQNIWKMGGLRKQLPKTYWSVLAACLAISAIPPFSGFFSKEEILWETYVSPQGGPAFWLLGVVTAGLTSFYIFRLFFLVFHGESRADAGALGPEPSREVSAPAINTWEQEGGHLTEADGSDKTFVPGDNLIAGETPAVAGPQHTAAARHGGAIHESPAIMTWPLMILAILSLVGGWVGIRSLGDHWNRFIAPAFQLAAAVAVESAVPAGKTTEIIFTIVSLTFSLSGIGLAYLFYVAKPEFPAALAARFRILHTLLLKKYFVDEIYGFLLVRPLVAGSREVLWKALDVGTIDGIVNGSARGARRIGDGLRRLQSGNIRSYAGWLVVGAVALIAFMVAVAS